MISILELGPNVLAYRAEGKLERADIERVFAELDRRLSSGEKIRIYAEVHSLSGISLEALWEDVRLGIQRWSAIAKIEKAALVTDLEWVRKAAVWEDRVLRGLHMRTFPLSGRAEAQVWVRP